MPTNQKYSARLHSKRQLTLANSHVNSTSKLLCDICERYKEALPRVSMGCEQMIEMLAMIENMINDIRVNI